MPNKKNNLVFPKGFLWGVSTSAYQVEGGIRNDWSVWERSEERLAELEKKGLDKNDFVCDRACDSYNRYEEDFDLAKDMGCGAFRLGIEWARIEPAEGEYDYAEIEHYKKVLKALRKRGLKSTVTLWHWTNPIWVACRDRGWADKKMVEKFGRYVEVVVKELGEYVDYWVTLNEPMIHVGNGYLLGKFPPNKKSLFSAIAVFLNLIAAHKKAYDVIHQKFPKAQVSITALVNYFEPARKRCLPERLLSLLAHFFWNDLFLARIKRYLDFVAVDYYFHDRIIWKPPFKKNLNKKTTDMGWEIFPEGIYHVIRYLRKFKKPIYIMENGIADARDKYREEFIKEHLLYVHKAIAEGADVRGYFYWSLLDNFEWAAGWAPKFGLCAVDRDTFKRTPRRSAEAYAEICKSNKLNI